MKRTTWINGLIATTATLALLHRYGKHSGATWAEYRESLPGDEVVPDPQLEITNAITIQAPAEKIWPWLVH